MKCLLPMTASLIMAVLMHADVRGQEPNAPPPEMKVLERLVGTWEVEQIVKVPEEARPTNLVVKRELVLGGRFVQEMGGFDDKGKPTFTGMYTYDSNRNTYRYWLFVSGGSQPGVGTSEARRLPLRASPEEVSRERSHSGFLRRLRLATP